METNGNNAKNKQRKRSSSESQPLLLVSSSYNSYGNNDNNNEPILLPERNRIIDFDPLIGQQRTSHDMKSPSSYGSHDSGTMSPPSGATFNRLRQRAWSFHGKHHHPHSGSDENNDDTKQPPPAKGSVESTAAAMGKSSSYGGPIPDRGGTNNLYCSSSHASTPPPRLLYRRESDDDGPLKTKSQPQSGILHNDDASCRYPQQGGKSTNDSATMQPPPPKLSTTTTNSDTKTTRRQCCLAYVSYLVYAIVNVIISVPAFYGYAAVIFSHDIYQDHMNSLSKLVVLSSAVHQISFTLFSSLPFAIGTVQDAGLIFLSAMSTKIAMTLLNDVIPESSADDDTLTTPPIEHVIVSTSIVLLSLGTAALGIVLMIMGHFRMAE